MRLAASLGCSPGVCALDAGTEELHDERHIMEHKSTAESLWYALRVRTKCEKIVAGGLSQRDIIHFLPLYKKTSQWSDRVKTSFVPLFPGYLFARISKPQLQRVITVPDFMYIVGQGNIPEPLDELDITAVRRLVAEGTGVGPWPFCSAGQVVEVIRGPLAGLRGVYVRAKSESRLVISLPLLQRSVSTEIESYNVRPISADFRLVGAA
jgi:transcription termination/antitermination protein NusG